MRIGPSAFVAAMTILMLSLAGCALGLAPPQLKAPPVQDVTISGVTILNPGRSRSFDQTIVLKDGKIAEVRPRREDDPPALCPGCIAMPGLIDAHVHNPPRLAIGNQDLFSLLYLAHGVTSVRDLGATDDSTNELVSRLNSGRKVGPNMYWCGRVLESAPVSFGAAQAVETAAEATAAVNDLADAGVDCIKVYNNLKPEPYAAIREAAKTHGLPVIGHIPHQVGLRAVVDFEAQHFTGVPYVRGGATPDHSDFRDPDFLSMTDEDIAAALDLAKANRISFLPTLANARLRLIASDPQRYPPTPAFRYLPKVWMDAWTSQTKIGTHPVADEIEAREERNALFLRITRIAKEKEIDILAGTDAMMPFVVPGESLLMEIDLLAEAFGDREAALAAATQVNARHIRPGEIGAITPGARGDILLLADDPTIDLKALREWRTLFVGGRRYDRRQIDAWLEKYRRHFQSPFYNAVMGLASRFVGGGRGDEEEFEKRGQH
jgi:hypothetical protein